MLGPKLGPVPDPMPLSPRMPRTIRSKTPLGCEVTEIEGSLISYLYIRGAATGLFPTGGDTLKTKPCDRL